MTCNTICLPSGCWRGDEPKPRSSLPVTAGMQTSSDEFPVPFGCGFYVLLVDRYFQQGCSDPAKHRSLEPALTKHLVTAQLTRPMWITYTYSESNWLLAYERFSNTWAMYSLNSKQKDETNETNRCQLQYYSWCCSTMIGVMMVPCNANQQEKPPFLDVPMYICVYICMYKTQNTIHGTFLHATWLSPSMIKNSQIVNSPLN